MLRDRGRRAVGRGQEGMQGRHQLRAFGVVQAFQKLPFLQPLASTQSEPPFLIAQIAVLAILIVLGFVALKRFHPPAGAAR
jgi:hypothetical protein